MAVDFFLNIKDIKGESMVEGHKDEIQLLSWSWGAHNSGSMAEGGGGGTGKVTMADFSFTMHVNKGSPQLIKACATGKHIDDALLCCRKSGGDAKPYDYLKIKFEHLLVSSYQTGGSHGSDDIPVDSITLNFAKITYDYFVQDTAKGTVQSAGPVSYDLKKAQAA